LVFGWNFQLSTIEPLKFSASQKLLKNKCNKALAFCLGIWQAQGFHKMVGLFSIGQRKGQTWESTISMDLRIQSSLSRISQNHFDLQVLIFYHSCSLLLWENQILLLILIPWFSLKSPDVSKLRVWPFRKGRSPFFAGPLLSISVSQFWAQRNRTQSNRVIREGDRRLKVEQNPQRNPVDMGKYPIIYMVYHGFIHSRWLFGISCINSMVFSQNDAWPAVLLDICPDRLDQSHWCFELDLGKVFRWMECFVYKDRQDAEEILFQEQMLYCISTPSKFDMDTKYDCLEKDGQR